MLTPVQASPSRRSAAAALRAAGSTVSCLGLVSLTAPHPALHGKQTGAKAAGRMENMVRNAVTNKAWMLPLAARMRRKIDSGNEVRFRGYAATRQITGYARKTIRRAKPKRYASWASIAPAARAEPNTPEPYQSDEARIMQLRKGLRAPAASRDSTLFGEQRICGRELTTRR